MKDNNLGVPLWLKILVFISIGLALVAIWFYFWSFNDGLATKHEVWGQFGDYIGGVLNPLFAFTALMALLYTIVIQSKELRNSARQLTKSAAALEAQNAVLNKQNFEVTFFQLLKLYNDIVKELRIDMKGSAYDEEDVREDRECLSALYDELVMNYIHAVNRGDDTSERPEALDAAYQHFYRERGHIVSHYFRTIYNIVKFVDRSDMKFDEKKIYTNFLRAQISKYEHGLLLYNCFSKYGNKKFLPLVIKYDLLKHIEEDVLAHPDDIALLMGLVVA